MTITSDPNKVAGEPKLTAVEQARQRRARRNAKIAAGPPEPLLERVRISARRVPFVAVLVALLAVALIGVLWLNTLTDEAGIRTNEAKAASAAAQQTIEGLNSEIAAKNATPAIAAAARSLGLVPAGDAAILVVPTDGGAPSVIGTPTPVVDPAVVAAAAQAAAQAAADAAAQAAAQAAGQAAADAAAQAAAQAAAAAQTTQSATSPTAPADPNPAPTTTAAATPLDQGAGVPTGGAALSTTQGAAG